MLGIGLMLLSRRDLPPAVGAWSDRTLKWVFWFFNGGLALMVFGSLLLQGIGQALVAQCYYLSKHKTHGDITMSATKVGLPTSLTPQVLKQILRYEPRHWKALKARLVKEHPAAWEDIHLSGDDFYTKLHALLKDPVNRWALEAAAQKESTKNRPLTLCCEIRKHYEKSLRNEPSFYDRLPKRPTPKEFVNALADCGDSDRLANVIWAFAESGSFTCADLAKIGEEHPSVRTRLGGVVKGIDMEAKPVAVRWVECLSRMRDTLEMAEKLGPDSEVAADFVGHADDLQKLALDFDRAAKAWASLTDLIDKHRNVLSHHSSLKPYVRVLDEGQSVGALTHWLASPTISSRNQRPWIRRMQRSRLDCSRRWSSLTRRRY